MFAFVCRGLLRFVLAWFEFALLLSHSDVCVVCYDLLCAVCAVRVCVVCECAVPALGTRANAPCLLAAACVCVVCILFWVACEEGEEQCLVAGSWPCMIMIMLIATPFAISAGRWSASASCWSRGVQFTLGSCDDDLTLTVLTPCSSMQEEDSSATANNSPKTTAA